MHTAAQIIGILLMAAGTIALALTALGARQFEPAPLAFTILAGAGLYIGFRKRRPRS